jgi:hypothetical protein
MFLKISKRYHPSSHDYKTVRASPVGRWMSRSNGNLAILDENRVPVVSACHSPSSAPRHFHSRTRYSVGHCWALDFPQQRWVTTHDGEVSKVMEAVTGEVTKVRVWIFYYPWLHLFVRLEREFCDFQWSLRYSLSHCIESSPFFEWHRGDLALSSHSCVRPSELGICWVFWGCENSASLYDCRGVHCHIALY